MQELNIPFEEVLVPFIEGSNWHEFRAFSPNGMVPCLKDKDLTVWDSLAILQYLAEGHPQIWPLSVEARAWARCAAAEMHSGFNALRSQCPMNCSIAVSLYQQSEELKHNIKRIDELWCEGLSRFGGPFLAGEKFTAVDAFYAPVIFRIQTFSLQFSDIAIGYAERILKLRSMVLWKKMAITEPWRDLAHEKEVKLLGKVTLDLRL
jgi:glutathione S-transferase